LIFNIVPGDCKTVKVSGDRKAIDVSGNREAVNTIFSPEDDTPFPRMPPSPREGRSRFWRQGNKPVRIRVTVFVFMACSGDGTVEEFDDVEDFVAGTVEGGAGAKLQEASRVGGNDGLGASGLGVAHFFGEQL